MPSIVRNFGVEKSWPPTKHTVMVLKCLHGLAPDYLASTFSQCSTSYNLRDSENKLNVRLSRTNYFKKRFSYGVALHRGIAFFARHGAHQCSLESFKRGISKAINGTVFTESSFLTYYSLRWLDPVFFGGGYHPTSKLSGIPTFTFIVSLTYSMDNI